MYFFFVGQKSLLANQARMSRQNRQRAKEGVSPVELMGKSYTLKVKCFMFGNI